MMVDFDISKSIEQMDNETIQVDDNGKKVYYRNELSIVEDIVNIVIGQINMVVANVGSRKDDAITICDNIKGAINLLIELAGTFEGDNKVYASDMAEVLDKHFKTVYNMYQDQLT